MMAAEADLLQVQPAVPCCPSSRSARAIRDTEPAGHPVRFDFDLDRLVDELATRVAAEVAERIASPPATPWMSMEEAIAYSRVPEGTFRKWVAAGRIPAHGGRRKLFHRSEVDAALGYEAAPERQSGRVHRVV